MRIVGEAEDGFSALRTIEETDAELVLLDVQMPGLDGFGVLEMLRGQKLPAIVFVTAFDHYAVRAFDVNAVDYLVKPFSRERFAETLTRVKSRLKESARGAEELASHLRATGRRPDWLLVKSGDRSRFVKVKDIDWIEAAKGSVLLHIGTEAVPFRATMTEVESSLDPARFLRIHRSTIVNVERVTELQPWFNGEYRVVMRGGTVLTLSANHRSELARFRSLSP